MGEEKSGVARRGGSIMVIGRSRSWIMVLPLLLFILLSIPRIPSVYALDDSSMLVTVVDNKFHVKIDFIIQLSIDDYTQFEDAEDGYSRDLGTFRGKLESSIESAVRKLVGDATIGNFNLRTVDCDEGAGKMHVELEFDIEGAITTDADGGKEYNLKWRSFKAIQKFSAEGRTIDPSEALGLDFTEFDVDLDDIDEWSIGETEGNTVIRKKIEYEIDTDEGEVDLRVTQKFTIPHTDLTINEDTVSSKSSQQAAESTEQQRPWIPGFPWEGVVIGLIAATATIILNRRVIRVENNPVTRKYLVRFGKRSRRRN
jgi:hypothetical protein